MQIRRSWISHQTIQDLKEEKKQEETNFITVRADLKTYRINFREIEYLQSLGDYVKIHQTAAPILTKEKISKLETKLPGNFLRIHRSYIINIHKIKSYTKEQVQIKDVHLSVSRTYKKRVIVVLDHQNRIAVNR